MCGISGFVANQVQAQGEAQEILDAMLRQISRRGPDGRGTLFENIHLQSSDAPSPGNAPWKIAFGHRRLSIIDLEGGAQPMRSPESGSFITYNGELFNFQELAAELKISGTHLRTRSDTEVLLELLVSAGARAETLEPALERLNGMFAFAFWDARNGALILVRDRFGIKPLYYAPLEGGGLAFASELTSVLEFPHAFDRSLDQQGLVDFFFHDSIPPPLTVVRGVRKLGLGEYLIWRPGKPIEVRTYWDPSRVAVENSSRSESELVHELRDHLARAVRRQLISDVPVGVFLSGGIDSSFVTALAVREASRGRAPIETFSIGFEERSFDESGQARQVATLLGTRHHEEILSEARMIRDLDETLSCLDEPLGDVSILPTYQVARLARSHVKVCLGGDGGDELFAGYSFYAAHAWGDLYGKLPGWARNRCVRPWVESLPVRDRYQSFEWKAKRFAHRWDASRLRRHFRWLAATDLPDLGSFFPGACEPSSFARWNDSHAASLDALLRLDLASYLPGSVLTKVDRATMGNGVEARPPFLDNDVVEFALKLPASYKLKGGVSKYLLKKAAGLDSLIPESILARKKQGFSVPVSRWIRRELESRIMESAESSELFRTGLLDLPRFREIFKEHSALRKDWGKTIWSFYVLDHWFRRNRSLLRID
jgi:asparagine synthase (glutamine-hydrolysing)